MPSSSLTIRTLDYDTSDSSGSILQTRRRFERKQKEESRVHRRESFNRSLMNSSATTLAAASEAATRTETMASSTSSLSRRATANTSELARSSNTSQQQHSASHFEALASSSSQSTRSTSSSIFLSSRRDRKEEASSTTSSKNINAHEAEEDQQQQHHHHHHHHHHRQQQQQQQQEQRVTSSSSKSTFFQSPSSLFPSLAQEIGSEFAELDNALSFVPATSLLTHPSRLGGGLGGPFGVGSLSNRLFGSTGTNASNHQFAGFGGRPISPTTLSRHHLIQETANSDFGARRSTKSSPKITEYSVESPPANEPLPLSVNGAKIRELMDKAQRHSSNSPSLDNTSSESPTICCIETPPGSASVECKITSASEDSRQTAKGDYKDIGSSNDDKNQKTSKANKSSTSLELSSPLRDNYCNKTVMKKVERIDQRMSDLCKTLQECQTTDEAIELLKIMIQMIEKAWSYPVCGDDFGFKLCNSLRYAGGLDIILGFINEADDGQHSDHQSEKLTSSGTRSPTDDDGVVNYDRTTTEKVTENSSQMAGNSLKQKQNLARLGKAPLRLSLTRLNQQQQHYDDSDQVVKVAPMVTPNKDTSESTDKASGQQEICSSKLANNGNSSATSVKDNDSDILTSDLGLDSTSVESLFYASASANLAQKSLVCDGRAPLRRIKDEDTNNNNSNEPSARSDDDLAENLDDEDIHTFRVSSCLVDDSNEQSLEQTEAKSQRSVDIEASDENQQQQQQQLSEEQLRALRKDELVFLSARLMSQCLTSENRDYIVKLGLFPVIRLACNYITMKSKRFVSRSLLSLMIKMNYCTNNGNQKTGTGATNMGELKQDSSSEIVSSGHGANHLVKQPASDIDSDHELTGDERQLLSDLYSSIGTEILQHLLKHSQETCSAIIALGGLQAILYGCRSSSLDTLRHCASALANLALYGGSDVQQTMIEQKAHVWLFPLAFNKDDNVQYYACLAIVVLAANQEIESDVLKSGTLDLVEPFVTSHEPRQFAESTTSHIHGQSAGWLRKLVPLLSSRREEARNLACFHFAMEAYIKREQEQTQTFSDIGALEPLKRAGSSPIAIASKFACQALRLIGEQEPHKLSQQVPLWTIEDVCEWVGQIGFERLRSAFRDSHADGDLLLQLDEEALRFDIGIENGIIRRRFLRELANLKRIADYSSVDPTNLIGLLASTLIATNSTNGSPIQRNHLAPLAASLSLNGGCSSPMSLGAHQQQHYHANGAPAVGAASSALEAQLNGQTTTTTTTATTSAGGVTTNHLNSTTGNSSIMRDYIQYMYPVLKMGITRDNIHLIDCDQLLAECRIPNSIHRLKLGQSIRLLQEQNLLKLASNEHHSRCGHLEHQKTLDCFVSYRRSTGSQLASLLKVHLQLRGFSVFIDVERLEAGKFDNNLLDSIKSARNFILVLSQDALDRCIGDQNCKDWVHKEIVAALASNCNIIPIMDNFQWPDAEQLPEDMRSIPSFNSVRWIHDYQDACVDKLERFIRGDCPPTAVSASTAAISTTTAPTTASTTIATSTGVSHQPAGGGGSISGGSSTAMGLAQSLSRFDRSAPSSGSTAASMAGTPSLTANQLALMHSSYPLEADGSSSHPLSTFATSAQANQHTNPTHQSYLQQQQFSCSSISDPRR